MESADDAGRVPRSVVGRGDSARRASLVVGPSVAHHPHGAHRQQHGEGLPDLAVPQDWRDAKLAELAIVRFGNVEEVAPTVVLLASDAGSYYVGATMNMNGGDYMI
jgi:NAD(P)-dependent dehydrogenase (short-subunit alcohol dehydrogenase family)